MIGLVFGQTIRYGFVNYDDDVHVYENPHVAHGLTLSQIAWAFTHSHHSNWIPLTCFVHGRQPVVRPRAGGFHLTNVLLHAATAVALFLVLGG